MNRREIVLILNALSLDILDGFIMKYIPPKYVEYHGHRIVFFNEYNNDGSLNDDIMNKNIMISRITQAYGYDIKLIEEKVNEYLNEDCFII